MSDSDEELVPEAAKVRAPNRHRFKTVSERIDEVDVDVYRRVGRVRSEPGAGSTCFFQENLSEWRELNAAGDWLAAERQLRLLTLSLPLLLHNKKQVVIILLDALRPEAALSLPPIFDLLVSAARDLQGEFIDLLPAVWNRFKWLLSPAPVGAGCAGDPDLLQFLFSSAAGLCKVLVKHITAALPATLRHTAGLRYHPERHVRCLAAETFGFLLRQASSKQLRSGLRALLAEAAVRPTAARAHGAGLMIAESVLGVEHGLHSKAGAVLGLMLQENLLQPEDFGGAAAAVVGQNCGTQQQQQQQQQQRSKAGEGLSIMVLRMRTSAVVAAAFNRLWEHTRRGHTQLLWEALLATVQRRLAAVENNQQQQQQAGAESASAAAEAVSNTARAVLLLAQGVHYFRGSRVEDYDQLVTVCNKLVSMLQQLPQQQQQLPQQQQQQLELQRLQLQHIQQQQVEHEYTAADFAGLTITHATMQLALGIILGHTKAVGASQGVYALRGLAAKWSTLFTSSSIPDNELLGFIQGIIVPPSTAAVAEVFAPQLLGGLGRILTSSAPAPAEASAENSSRRGQALAMLVAACELLRPGATAVGSGLPLLLTAQPNGPDLAAAVLQLAAAWSPCSTASSSTVGCSRQQLLYCWAGLQLLPHAYVKPLQAVELCSQVLTKCNGVLPALSVQPGSTGSSSSSSGGSSTVSTPDVLQLRGMALTMLSQLLPAARPAQHSAVAADALSWLKQYKHLDYATVSATAAVLDALRARLQDSQGYAATRVAADEDSSSVAALADAQLLLSVQQLPSVIELLLPCLLSPSQKLRAAALQLKCCFDQPAYLGSGTPTTAAAAPDAGSAEGNRDTTKPPGSQADRSVFEGYRCDVLVTLRDIHLRPCTVEAGRRWSVALERMANHLEYGRVPGVVLPALVAGLIGTLHIRFSPLWQPASEALAEALTHNTITAWPIILQHVTQTQQQFLADNNSSHTAAEKQQQQQQPANNSFDLQQQYQNSCQQGYGVAAAASGTSTDAANRLTNLLKGLAGKASPGVLHQVSDDWVPLLLSFAAAVTHGGSSEADAVDADSEVCTAAAGAEEDEQQQTDHGVTAAGSLTAVSGSKRKQLEPAAPHHQQHQRLLKRQRGVAAGLHRGGGDGVIGLNFSHKAWRSVMREWLALLAALRNPQKLKRAPELQEAVARQLLSTDPALQTAAIKCLSSFKLPYLPPHLQTLLLQLADVSKLRNGLMNIPSMFDTSSSSSGAAEDEQLVQQQQRHQLKSKKGSSSDVGKVDAHIRPGFISLLTLVLYPRLAKRSGRLGGRGAPGSARAAVLNALAALQPHELVPLMELLLMPISNVFQQQQQQQGDGVAAEGAATSDAVTSSRLISAPWWSKHLVNSQLDWWLTAIDQSKLGQQPLRRRQGFLNAFEDLLQHLGFRLQPLLPVLLALTLKQLELACAVLQHQEAVPNQQQQGQVSAATAAATAGTNTVTSREEGRAVRSQCLSLLAQIFTRLPASLDYNSLWPGFLRAVKPLMPRLLPESVSAAPPALLVTVTALATNPGLARVLGNMPSQQIEVLDEGQPQGKAAGMGLDHDQLSPAAPAGDQPAWAVEGLGGQLLISCIRVLGVRGCSEASRSAALTIVESCLALQPQELLAAVLLPWVPQLLVELRSSVESVLAEAAAWGARGPRGASRGRGGQKRPSVVRQLALMEQLGQHCTDTNAAASLAAALVALLTQPNSSRSGGSSAARSGGAAAGLRRTALDERGYARALGAVAGLWAGLSTGDQGHLALGAVDQQLDHWEVISLLFGQLTSRDSRTAAAAAMKALGQLIDSSSSTDSSDSCSYAAVADILADLNSWSPDTLDEPDYDCRLSRYSKLGPEAWRRFNRLQALPLLLQAFFDLRNEGDLALRQAAAAALSRVVVAYAELDQQQQLAAAAAANPVQQKSEHDDPLRLLPRVIYPQAKGGLRGNNLAVRQEHAALLRELVQQLPQRFPDLMPLTAQDPEQDFFLNITHLQIHRRGRALQMLSRLLQQQQQQQQQQSVDQQVNQRNAGPSAAPESAAKRRKLNSGEQQSPPPSSQQQQQQQNVSVRVLLDIAAPLLQQFIFDGAGSSAAAVADQRGGHAKKQGDADREGAVADAAIDTLREIAKHLSWQQYSALLQRWLKLMTQHPKKQVIRATCAILDAFHFDVDVSTEQQQELVRLAAAAAARADDARQQQQQAGEDQGLAAAEGSLDEAGHDTLQQTSTQVIDGDDQQQNDDDDEDFEGDDEPEQDAAAAAAAVKAAQDAADVAAAAQKLLLMKVLPALQSQLVIDGQEVARAPVALALVKLIKLLPADVERIALPRCLSSIGGLLRSRLHSSRDAARDVLGDLALELGPEYMPTIINVLRAVLPDKGFTAHVLGYTAAGLLEAHVKAGVEPGQLDDSLELLLPTIEGDLFGQVAEAKEVSAFAGKYKEAKRCRAYEAFQHLAAAVTFDSHVDTLLALVRDKLPAATSPSARAKLEQLLTAAARGLSTNPSITAEGLAHWLASQLESCLRVEESARAKAKASVGAAIAVGSAKGSAEGSAAADGGDVAGAGAAGAAHLYLLTHFYLTVLNGSLKRGVLSGRDPDSLALLDSVLPLLVRCLDSRHMGTVQGALKALTVLVSAQQLPGLAAAAAGAGKSLSSLLRKVPDAGHPLAQDCFKLLGAMLRDCPSYQPPTPQIRFLLKWISADLQSGGTATSAAAAIAGTTGGGSSSSTGERVSGYGLLRAVLSRKLLVPEVYDVMDIVQKQMITSHSAPGRSTAAAALVQFLLDYPLSPSRLQTHVAFLLTNTAYEHETGRLQALEMLQQVLLKFPPAVVSNLSATVYLPLVTRLANENSPKARTAVAATIKLLHKQLQQEQNDMLATYSQQWLVSSGSQQQQLLRVAAAHALGLLAEVEGSRFAQRRLKSEFVDQLVNLLTAAAAEAEEALTAAVLDHQQQEAAAGGLNAGFNSSSGVPRWQEVYHILLMLEKACQGSAAALRWQQGAAAQRLWHLLLWQLLLHPHLWVRKVAGRLLGLALATPAVTEGLLNSSCATGNPAGVVAQVNGVSSGDNSNQYSVAAGAAALLVYRQLEADVVDEGLCTQAVKCLVALARSLAAQQQQINGAASHVAVNGHHIGSHNDEAAVIEELGDGDSDSEIDMPGAEQQHEAADAATAAGDGGLSQQHKKAAVTLQGLIVRMVKMAEDTRYARQLQRLAALRWLAAVAVAVGTEPLLLHLPLLLRPLYRISEATGNSKIQQQASQGVGGSAAAAAGGTSEEVRVLSEQVLAHLRTLFGSDQLLTAYTAAREAVRTARAIRKTAAARRVLLDPEAASRLKIKKGKKKGEARQRKAEERRRQRSSRSSGGFGYKHKAGGQRGGRTHGTG